MVLDNIYPTIPTAPPAYDAPAAVANPPLPQKTVEVVRYPTPWLHRLLLVASAGISIATLVPASRHIAGLILRSVSFLSSSAICADSWDQEDALKRTLNIGRIGVVALGIIGIATAKPAIYVASLIAQVALQSFELGKALYDRDAERIVTHAGMLVLDSLVLGAVLSGAWQVMVTAAAVNAFAMLCLAFKTVCRNDAKEEDIIDMIAYVALTATSVIAGIELGKISERKIDKATLNLKNDKKEPMIVFDSDKNQVCTIKPGEEVTLDYKYPGNQPTARLQVFTMQNGYPEKTVIMPNHRHYTHYVLQQPMKAAEYPYLAVGNVVDRHQV